MKLRLAFALASLLTAAPGCHHKRYPKAPYARGENPEPAALLAATAPRFSKLRVPKAKIREGRSPAARLLLLAEGPSRMLGTIEVAGNPLVTLALHERAYGLRTVREAPGLAAGWYHGPPSRCAVASLLGVDLEPDQVVALLLGGGPQIDGPFEVVEQGWSKGRERLVLRNARYEEELAFAWVDGGWWFAGAKLWSIEGGGRTWLWTISHEDLEGHGGVVLPEKTHIDRPGGKKGSVEMTISYQKQVATAAEGKVVTGDGDGDEGGDDTGGFDDDGGWEDEGWDDEGWDDEGEGASTPKPAPTPTPAPEPEADPIPPEYQLSANGLPDRGDLCARR